MGKVEGFEVEVYRERSDVGDELSTRVVIVERDRPGIEEAEQATSCRADDNFVSATVVQRQPRDMDELVDYSSCYVSVSEVALAVASAVLGACSRINYAWTLAIGIAIGALSSSSWGNIGYVDS